MFARQLVRSAAFGVMLAASCGNPAPAPAPAVGPTSCPEVAVLESGVPVEGELPRRGEYSSPCGPGGEEPKSGEALFLLPVETPSRVMVQIDARFRPVVFVRRDCLDTNETILACRSGPETTTTRRGRRASETLWSFEFALAEGRYVLVIDGYDRGGEFTLSADLLPGAGADGPGAELAELTGTCEAAQVLQSGVETPSRLGTRSRFASSCGGYGFGPEAVFAVDVPRRSEVELVVTSRFVPVLYVRRQCEDPGTTAWCDSDAHELEEAVDSPLKEADGDEADAAAGPPPEARTYALELGDEGRYWVFVDTADRDAAAPQEAFTVRAEIGSRRR